MEHGTKVRIKTELVFLAAPDIQTHESGETGVVIEWHSGMNVSPPHGNCVLVKLQDGSYADILPDSLEVITE